MQLRLSAHVSILVNFVGVRSLTISGLEGAFGISSASLQVNRNNIIGKCPIVSDNFGVYNSENNGVPDVHTSLHSKVFIFFKHFLTLLNMCLTVVGLNGDTICPI